MAVKGGRRPGAGRPAGIPSNKKGISITTRTVKCGWNVTPEEFVKIKEFIESMRSESKMFFNLKDGQLAKRNYRLTDATITTQDNLIENFLDETGECLTATIENEDADGYFNKNGSIDWEFVEDIRQARKED